MSFMTHLRNFFATDENAPTDAELADMGLSRIDFNQLITSKDGTRARMEVLAARFGVTPRMIDTDLGLSLELSRTCGHCLNAKVCQNAIDLDVEMDTSLCPNASIYADMSPT